MIFDIDIDTYRGSIINNINKSKKTLYEETTYKRYSYKLELPFTDMDRVLGHLTQTRLKPSTIVLIDSIHQYHELEFKINSKLSHEFNAKKNRHFLTVHQKAPRRPDACVAHEPARQQWSNE